MHFTQAVPGGYSLVVAKVQLWVQRLHLFISVVRVFWTFPWWWWHQCPHLLWQLEPSQITSSFSLLLHCLCPPGLFPPAGLSLHPWFPQGFYTCLNYFFYFEEGALDEVESVSEFSYDHLQHLPIGGVFYFVVSFTILFAVLGQVVKWRLSLLWWVHCHQAFGHIILVMHPGIMPFVRFGSSFSDVPFCFFPPPSGEISLPASPVIFLLYWVSTQNIWSLLALCVWWLLLCRV